MSDLTTHMDAGAERLLEESLGRRQQRARPPRAARQPRCSRALPGRRGARSRCSPTPSARSRRCSPLPFVAALAVVARVELWGGAGYARADADRLRADAAAAADAARAAARRRGARARRASRTRCAAARRSGAARSRSATRGSASARRVVLVAFGAQLPDWESLAGLRARARRPAARRRRSSSPRACGSARACRPRRVLPDLRLVYRVDVLLSPIGLLAALAAADAPAAALLVLPLAYLLLSSPASARRACSSRSSSGRAYRGTALLLRDLLEEDDEYTGRHTEDVVGLTVSVAERMGLDEDTRRSAELGALLHDIGKIAVPDEIINKPGPLNDEEWAIMKTHTVEGERMLAQVGGLLADVGLVVRASHERWDGGGYPDGLAGEAIPLAACIVSACDAFNAMTTDRSYRKALPLVGRASASCASTPAPSSARPSSTRSSRSSSRPRPPRRARLGGSPWRLRPLPRLLRRSRRRARPSRPLAPLRQRRLVGGERSRPSARRSRSQRRGGVVQAGLSDRPLDAHRGARRHPAPSPPRAVDVAARARPRPSLGLGRPRVADRLDVVAVGIEHEGGVVALVVLRPPARGAVVGRRRPPGRRRGRRRRSRGPGAGTRCASGRAARPP